MSAFPDDLINLQEACALTGLPHSTFRLRIKQGVIKTYYPNGRTPLVSKAELIALGLRRYSPQTSVDEWIDRLVENAPALTDVQLNRLQAVLVTAAQDR